MSRTALFAQRYTRYYYIIRYYYFERFLAATFATANIWERARAQVQTTLSYIIIVSRYTHLHKYVRAHMALYVFIFRRIFGKDLERL